MEIIFFLMISGFLLPFLLAFPSTQIGERTVKVVKANLNSRKQIVVPGIVTADMKALEPRNKDWGPDGKLTQMWQDAFDYWQLKDPAGTLESYRIKQHEWEQRRDELQSRVTMLGALYEKYISRYDTYSAADVLGDIRKAKGDLSDHGYGPDLTENEQAVAGLVERYGSEVYYNNDMVRLSAQKQMPTFDYIALTSV